MNQKPLKWLLSIGIAAASVILWKDLLDPEQSIRFLYLTVLGALALVILWKKDEEKLAKSFCEIIHWKNPILICVVIWLFATVISIPGSLQKSEGYVETARVLFFLFSYIWLSACFRMDTKNILYVSVAFCIIGFILSIIGLKDFLQVISKLTADDTYYQMGNMGNRNLLAIMVSLCLPFHLLVFGHYKSPLIRTGLALNFLLGVTVVMFTNSRVGWLGLVALFAAYLLAFMAMSIKGAIEKKMIAKLSLGFLAFGVALAVPVLILFTINPAASDVTGQRLKSLIDFRSEKNIHTESISERLQIWSSSFQLIKENPLTGVGAGNWKFRYAEKGLPERAQRGSVVFLQPHNDFLWVFSETGVMGGLAFALLFVAAIATAATSLLKPGDLNGNVIIAVTLFTGACLYAVHSTFDFPKERPLISFAFAGVLALASTLDNKRTSLRYSIGNVRIILVTLFISSAMISWLWIARIQGELNLNKAIIARTKGDLKTMKRHLEKISSTFFQSDLNGTPIDWYRSELAYYSQDRAGFKKYSESSIKLNPYQLYNLYNLGSIYYKEGDIKTAVYYWEKAVSIAPRFTDAAVNLSAAYYNQKYYVKAAELLATPSVNFQNDSYSTIVATVLGRYINMVSDTISHPVLKEALRNLSVNPEKIKILQASMVAENEPPRKAALAQVIRETSETGGGITMEEAQKLRTYYGLNHLRRE